MHLHRSWRALLGGRLDLTRRETRDALVIFGAAVASFMVATAFELPPILLQFGLDHADWEIDDIMFVAFMVSAAMLAYGFRRYQDLAHEIEARRTAEQEARNLARHDPLTGLANRRFFEEKLAEHLLGASEQRPLAVLLLDLDGFKLINDTHGHAAGDRALCEFADRVAAIVRPTGFAARLGGDEFAILVPHVQSPDDAAGLAERICATAAEPLIVDRATVTFGVSIGIALAPSDGDRTDDLLRRADRALYRAKAAGQSSVRFFESEMDAHFERRKQIERELRQAILDNDGSIVPFYQPLVSLDQNRVIGFEALCRWRSEALGPVPPDVFIPIAEETQLINPLGDRLLRQACRDARDWPDGFTLAFNVSAVQLHDPSFCLRVLAALGETGLDPAQLELEITETAFVENIELMKTVIDQLRQVGIRVALDDFGTGYATLSHLLSLQFDKIKIDRSFVSRLDGKQNSQVIIRAILGLAKGFGLVTTAEGIEDVNQLSYLRTLGCTEGQGYLFSKAMAAGDIPAFLDRMPQESAA
ncbi:MAG: EAL domain-containing protein [Bradyrhizobium sp.]|uniref:putative bifunctional diguanylate cyclase/phosphodiesterase n=1 Tax=Bradyrhizobium sp. TaxID=376 RepID=UPI001E0D1A10|nr:EAL domain-containing protein [Bradyrhizobium sp.]MBV9560876.1 EAL domain-containing protein [Bradyrhizobium sp.]